MKIEEYTLADFVRSIEKAVKDGYSIDYDDNASYPTGGMGHYRCVMHKGAKVAALLKPKPEPEPEVVEATPQYQAPEKPFVPSIVFEANELSTVVKKTGRPKSQRV